MKLKRCERTAFNKTTWTPPFEVVFSGMYLLALFEQRPACVRPFCMMPLNIAGDEP